MRGFFGCAVGAEYSARLHEAALALPVCTKLQPLHPADYHVTIKFLSEFSSTNFFACLDELCALGGPPADALRAGKLALWPTVIALECEPSNALVSWHGRVNDLLERRGFIKERHARFFPHVTLARRKEGWRLPEVEAYLAGVENQFRGHAVPLDPPALWRTEHEGSERRHREVLSPWFPG